MLTKRDSVFLLAEDGLVLETEVCVTNTNFILSLKYLCAFFFCIWDWAGDTETKRKCVYSLWNSKLMWEKSVSKPESWQNTQSHMQEEEKFLVRGLVILLLLLILERAARNFQQNHPKPLDKHIQSTPRTGHVPPQPGPRQADNPPYKSHYLNRCW